MFVVDFQFCVCGSVYQRKKEHDEGWLVVQMEKREKKRSESEIIKILYTRATITVYIFTVTVALG